jgi:pyruvate formate lyase activating enzyme
MKVGGVVPFSTVDFPGKLAAVVFFQGCPWRCGYCHNPHLLSLSEPDADGWVSTRAFLERRRGMLDAVVFSGGEPTAQEGLAACAREAREMGFAVGLHTGGAYPDRLKAVLPWTDWVGLDIKARVDAYPAITGVSRSGNKAWESLGLVLESQVAFECRTTVHPCLHSFEEIHDLAQHLAERGVRHYAVQAFRSKGCADPALASSPGVNLPNGWVGQMESLFESFVYRGP